MKQGLGLSVYGGIAMGPAAVWRRACKDVSIAVGTPDQEQARFDTARETARRQLTALYENARRTVGEDEAAIIEVQMLMLDDLDYLEAVAAAIASGSPAPDAALDTGEEFASFFAAMDDAYMQAWAADVRDMARRIYDILCGGGDVHLPDGEFLLIAEDLAPSETIQLPTQRILGIITRQGSTSSHTAILCRTLNIPLIVQADLSLKDAENADIIALDSFAGVWYTDPDETTLDMLQQKQSAAAGEKAALEAYRGRESVTRSGRKIMLDAMVPALEAMKAVSGTPAEILAAGLKAA